MTSTDDKWLEKILDGIAADLKEIKKDTKQELREIKKDVQKLTTKEAHRTGAMVVVNTSIAIVINFLATWLGSKH
jgi:vacuolar-type H+-ATPase subunit E/Vma4